MVTSLAADPIINKNKELDGTCTMAHQPEALTATTDTVGLVHTTGIRTSNPWVRSIATLYFTTRLNWIRKVIKTFGIHSMFVFPS